MSSLFPADVDVDYPWGEQDVFDYYDSIVDDSRMVELEKYVLVTDGCGPVDWLERVDGSTVDAVSAARHILLRCNEWFEDTQYLDAYAVGTLLTMFYGFRNTKPRQGLYSTIDLAIEPVFRRDGAHLANPELDRPGMREAAAHFLIMSDKSQLVIPF